MFRADSSQEKWQFFRAGGVVQVDLKTPADLLRLGELDPKHWMALAMPVSGVQVDPRTLALLDSDQDGQIRPPEIISSIQWLNANVKDFSDKNSPAIDMDSSNTSPNLPLNDVAISLSQIAAPELVACAERILLDLKTEKKVQISLSMVDEALQLFKESPLNGDGVITEDGTDDPGLKSLIDKICQTFGHEIDRSGKKGLTEEKVVQFFAALELRREWLIKGLEFIPNKTPPFTAENIRLVEALIDLNNIYLSIKKPIDDFFLICHLKMLSPHLAHQFLEPKSDSASLESLLEKTPLASLDGDRNPGTLDLKGPLNPLWSSLLSQLTSKAHELGLWFEVESRLSEESWNKFKALMAMINDWQKSRPQTPLDGLPPSSGAVSFNNQEVLTLLASGYKQIMLDLIQTDLQKASAYTAHADLQKLLLYKRDLFRITSNFVNFSDFYRFRNGIFQAGTLYVDGRSTELCIEQINPTRHTSLDILSGAFVVYCDLNRANMPPKSVICIVTDGEGSQIIAGRAGIFIDKKGQDWSALITKVIANPVSYREAFWSPYRRIVRWVEEQISKKMAAADVTSPTELAKVSATLPIDQVAPSNKDAKGETFLAKKIDVGTVAALGVALGSIGTFVGLLTSKFFGLGVLMPFGLLGMLLMISGPSVVLAWFKLKNRNLAPILDANGWAINTRAIINVPFASSLTSLRQIPLSLGSVMPDPYAEKDRPWKLYWTFFAIFFLLIIWLGGYFDRYLPEKFRYQSIIEQKPKVTLPQ